MTCRRRDEFRSSCRNTRRGRTSPLFRRCDFPYIGTSLLVDTVDLGGSARAPIFDRNEAAFRHVTCPHGGNGQSEGPIMDRRAFLKSAATGALATAGTFATPAISQRAAARALRFVPQADLANFDPIWNTQYVVRNGAALIWDMLYGADDRLQPRRQMVEAEQTSADGLVWTFRLRSGLKFHDGEPVLARDVVASIARWEARDNMGLMLKAIEQELAAIDDSTFRWTLKKPFPKLLVALGKIGTPSCFIMPARIAATDPFKPINEYVGSGPMKFVRDEWVPGARAVFERFANYLPRQ